MNQFAQLVSHKLNISVAQVEAVLNLFAEGGTIPFIARYRKDKTGALDEVAIAAIQDTNKLLQKQLPNKTK
jgi:protein Tex